jgi:murE/murF fusion protein
VPGLRSLAGEIASRYYGSPASRLKLVAVTGTNGKTTCTHWIAEGLAALGQACGVIGTLGWGRSGKPLQPFGLTMPDVLALHAMLSVLERNGAVAVAMEATSIGLDQGRLDGVQPAVAVLTNLTRDHLDYHGSFEAYARAKSPLGPFERIGKILGTDPAVGKGAGHHSVLRLPGTDEYVICYHRRPLEETDANARQVCLDKLEFDADGNILPVRQTFTGVAAHPIP